MMKEHTEIISMTTGEVFGGLVVGKEHNLADIAYVSEMADEKWLIEWASERFEIVGIEKGWHCTYIWVID